MFPSGLDRAALTAVLGMIAMLLWALLPFNPYGYYMLLRVILCPALAYLAWVALNQGRPGWPFVLGFAALLYNPFVRVSLTREIWSVVNVLTIAMLMFFAYRKRIAK